MKLKLYVVLIAAFAFYAPALRAQTHLQEEQINSRYQSEKRGIQTAERNELNALKLQRNLTPQQRERQRRAIEVKYNQQLRANQVAFENEKRTFHEQNKTVKDQQKYEKKEMKEDMKDQKKDMKEEKKDMKEAKKYHHIEPRPMHAPKHK